MPKIRPSFIIASGIDKFFSSDIPHKHTLFNYGNIQAIGSNKVIERPTYKGIPYELVKEAGTQTMLKYEIDKKYPEYYAFECDMASKTAPTSIVLPYEQLAEVDLEYWKVPAESKHSFIPLDDLSATVSHFSKMRNTKFGSTEKTISDMTVNSTYGAPYGIRRSRAEKLLRLSMNRARADLEPYIECGRGCPTFSSLTQPRVEWEGIDGAAVRGHRSQEGSGSFGYGRSDKPIDWSKFISKQRTVFAMPADLNGLELMAYKPLIRRAQKTGLIPAYCCQEEVDKCVTALFVTKSKDDYVIATDFTKFDHSFGPSLQHAARFILDNLLSMSNYDLHQGGINHIYPVKFNIPLICNQNRVIYGSHGMASGSGGTNLDESLAHKALQIKCARDNGQTLNPYSMAYGDDGVLTFPGISIDKVLASYLPTGVTMNKSKQMIDKHCTVVLRRLYLDTYLINGIMVPLYSSQRANDKARYKEKWTNPKLYGDNEVRQTKLAICELLRYSPLFELFVDFQIAGDRDRLGLDLPGGISAHISGADANPDKVDESLNYTMRNEASCMSSRKYPTFGKETTVTDEYNQLTKGYFFDRETADPAAGIRNGRVVQYLLERERREKAGNPDLGCRAIYPTQIK